ncbi:deoxycytidylate deaminase [Thermaerobacter subterraneus]|uniref:Deoxycytidylate deaminase n=1 Tax=Thermaerobacter subterraneus DSM 13965 TaxID=867903 RepID=K6QEX3_9FIRM|nr:deoxycytidylate deaminase [Thermaerobacter subterraneus DSM 13965]
MAEQQSAQDPPARADQAVRPHPHPEPAPPAGSRQEDPADQRPPWDAYFMELAEVVARRSTCPRRHVGAVLVRDRRILATGYNGAPPGFPHCTEAGCLMQDGHCVRTIHAEANAILQAALHGVTVKGSTLYTTATPCLHCAKLLIGAGVVRVVYRDWYPDPRAVEFLERAGIPLEPMAGGAGGPAPA